MTAAPSTTPVHILILTEDDYRGGVDRFITTLVNEWPANLDRFTILVNEDHPGVPVIRAWLRRPCAVRTYRVWSHGAVEKALHGRHPILRAARRATAPIARYGFLLWHVAALARVLREAQADRLLVVNGGYPGSDICRAAVVAWRRLGGKRDAVHVVHNLALPIRWFERIQERAIDAWVGRFGTTVVVSEACREALVRERPRLVRVHPPVVIPNGVSDVSAAPPSARGDLRRSLGLPATARICLTLATFEPRKGHAFLVEAFEHIARACPDAHLLMAGDGTDDEVRAVRALVARSAAGARVHLFPFLGEVEMVLAGADVLLVPSQAFESFGLVCVEAFRAGVPVVSTDVGGLPEVVGDAGVIVPHADVEGFAAAAVDLLASESRRGEAARRGLARYRARFTADRMARDYAARLA